MQIEAAHMVATGAAMSHPGFDPEKSSELLRRSYYDTLACIPYMTGGKSGTDIMLDDRMKAVNAYLEMKRKATKGAE